MPEKFTVPAKRLTPVNEVDGLQVTLPAFISGQCVSTPTLLQISSESLRSLHFFVATVVVLATLLFSPSHVAAAITPITWDTIGLDSNSPTSGPFIFPVGARITGPANTPGSATLQWEDPANPDPYITIRNNQTLNFTFDSSGNADVYFEVQIPAAKRTTSAYGQTRRYYITSGGNQSVTRELYIERLISQGRNAVTDIKVGTTKTNMVSVPNGGNMSLLKDNTYYIQLVGYTATSGYEQLEAFINFDNTVIQILSVEAYGSATSSTIPYLYADACSWDADPNSLNYRSCLSTGKFGGNITVTYQIKVLSVGSGSQQLNSLIHDFSGSSFHYNSDYSTTARTMYLIDPANATMSKSFFPNPTDVATGSTLTFTINNPNAGAISGLNFTDDLTTVVVTPSGGTLRVATTPSVTNTCGGTVTDLGGVNPPSSGSTGIMLTDGTVGGNSSCTIRINVTASAGSAAGTTYANTAGQLKVKLADGNNVNTTSPLATATLTVSTAAPPAPPTSGCANPVELARWNLNGTDYTGAAIASAGTSITSGSYLLASTKRPDIAYARAWANFGSASQGGMANATTTPWGGCSNGCNAGKPYPNSADTTNSWGYTGGWPAATPAPTATTQPAFEFELDSANYGGLGFATDYDLEGNWSNNDKWYLWGSADGSNWTQLNTTTNTWGAANKGAWTTGGIFNNTTLAYAKYFRITVAGAQYSGSGAGSTNAAVYLDNVKIIGCPRIKAPLILKHFAPNPVLVNGTSKLTFTISNPNLDADLTATSFTDDFTAAVVTPAGGSLKVAATPAVTSDCGGTVSNLSGVTPLSADSTGIKLTGATVPKGGTCTVTVNVTATANGTYLNTATVFDTNAGASYINSASDTLTVQAPQPAIAIFKEVATATSAPAPDSSQWRSEVVVKKDDNIYYQFTVQNDGDVQLKDVQAVDAAFPNLATCNGTGWKYGDGVTTVPLDGSNKFTLEVASNSDPFYKDFATCIIGASPVIPALNDVVSNTATVSATYNSTALPFIAALMQDTAKYYGFIPPTVTKTFGTGNITSGGNTTLTLTLGNPSTNPGNLTGVKVDDTFPAGMTLKDTTFTFTPAACGTVTRTDGTTASVAGDNAIRFAAGSIAANTTCQAQVNITSSTVGSVTNTTGTTSASGVVVAGKSASLAQTGASANASLTVMPLPSLMILKSAVVSTGNPKARPGDTITYTVTVTETNGNSPDLNSVILSDYLKDSISNYVDLRVDTYGTSPYKPFSLSPGTSGLTLGLHEYSTDNGTSWVSNNPPNPSGGYDPTITNWRLTLNGTMTPSSSFSLTYSVRVK